MRDVGFLIIFLCAFKMPDEIAAKIASLAADTAAKYRTFDGRMAGVSLSNSSGASQGMDTNGPTAMINAYFTGLSTTTQNEIIERTEN